MYRVLPLALAIAGVNAFANEKQIEHVLVSVPIHKKAAETALSVTVLSGDELRRQMSSSIGETLSKQPGLASASFGPGVGQPVIRGQQGPRTQVLQNSTASADVAALSPDHAVAVEPMLADSIEVLRGPATLLYGGGAIGGVVNIIDNRIPSNLQEGIEGGLEYRHDTASDSDTVVARIDGGSGKFAFHLDGVLRDYNDLDIPGKAVNDSSSDHDNDDEYMGADGKIGNTSGDSNSYTVGGSYHFSELGFAGLSISHLESNYGIPPGSHEHEEEHGEEHEEEHGEEHEEEEEEEEEIVRLDMEQTRYDGAIHIHEPFDAIEMLRVFGSFTEYEHVELEGGEIGTQFDRETLETRIELVHKPIGNWHGVFGVQWRQGEFEAKGDEAYVPATDSEDLGVFLVEDYHSGDWTFELGARLDRAERNPDSVGVSTESYTSVSASASALWNFTPQWSTSLALSRSERAPVTQELYSNIEATDLESLVTHVATGAIEIGDPELDTESALNADLSLAWNGDTSFAELTVFYNDFRDYIFLSNDGQERDETPILSYAQEDTVFYGVEFDSNIPLGIVLAGTMELRVFGDMVIGEFDDSGDVPRLPPARIGSSLDWSKENLTIWTDVVIASDQDEPGINEVESDGYTRWDAGIDIQLNAGTLPPIELFLKLKNISDEEIRLSTSFLRDIAPEAGRSIEAGVRFNF
ncbi:MAG: TonB-dependent receptor [Halioglobus sp.]